MFDVFYWVILNTIVYRFVDGDQLNLVASDGQSGWKQSFDSCKDPNYWHQIFDNCQPESCNASKVADKIINKSGIGGRQQYWIYGYVLRSPVIVNIGCYSFTDSLKNEFYRGNFSFQHNSAFECSMACRDDSVEYFFLRGEECLCIQEQLNNHKLIEENTGTCNQSCAGNSRDLCGGTSVANKELLYSVYQVMSKRISNTKVGSTCAELAFDVFTQQRFDYTTCNSKKMFICGSYEKSGQFYADTCLNKTVSWYAAQQNCRERGLQLRSYTSSSFSSTCAKPEQRFWIGNHVAEKIVWADDSLPKNRSCLTLVIEKSGSTFETENCTSKLYALCYKQQHTSSGNNDEKNTAPSIHVYSSTGRTSYDSSISTMIDLDEDTTNILGRATLRGPVKAESDSDEDKSDLIPIIAGSVGGFVALVIVVIIVFIIQRRKKSNHKHLNTAVDEGEPETYTEPIKNTVPEESKLVVENTIPEENLKLVNVTEEGIYNHLGDSEKMIEMKPQDSSIYDVTGDDEYHVFTRNGKHTIKDDDDLYDHGAASDVYNTLNDTVKPNRPESDTYNIINAK